MARLLLTRPEEDARETARRLEERGHQVLVTPLMVIDVLGGGPLDLNGVQALLVTSVNGLRAFMHRQGGRVPRLPVYAVGDATARVAREMGFKDVKSAGGDVGALARRADGFSPGGLFGSLVIASLRFALSCSAAHDRRTRAPGGRDVQK